jgi:hypothetical protein
MTIFFTKISISINMEQCKAILGVVLTSGYIMITTIATHRTTYVSYLLYFLF